MAKITKAMQEILEYTDEQVESLEDNQVQYINKIVDLYRYKVVAEVVESRNCLWGAKVGDKIVLGGGGGGINTKECTNKEGLCLHAVTPLQPFAYMIQDYVVRGLDPTKMVFKRMGCLDTGVEHRGWGKVIMDIRVEQIPDEDLPDVVEYLRETR